MKVFEFTGDITFDDFVQMNRYNLKDILLKVRLPIIIIPALLIVIGFNVYSFINNGYLRFFEDILPIFVFILIWVLTWFYMVNRPKILFKKFYADNKIIKEKKDILYR